MKEPHEQGVANQFGPESCANLREETGEAFDRGKSRPAIELRNHHFVRADPVLSGGRPYGGGAYRKPTDDATESETLVTEWLTADDGLPHRVQLGFRLRKEKGPGKGVRVYWDKPDWNWE